jgi:hypothetical protein
MIKTGLVVRSIILPASSGLIIVFIKLPEKGIIIMPERTSEIIMYNNRKTVVHPMLGQKFLCDNEIVREIVLAIFILSAIITGRMKNETIII